MNTIYMPLVDEGINVWRPVLAMCIDELAYKISVDLIVPAGEVWKFNPGDCVWCVEKESGDGVLLVANEIISKDLSALLSEGRNVSAIKIHQAIHGVTLAKAKHDVEKMINQTRKTRRHSACDFLLHKDYPARRKRAL